METIFVKEKKGTLKKTVQCLFFPLSFLFCELVIKLSVFGAGVDISTLWLIFFSLSAGALFTGFLAFLPYRACRVAAIVLSALMLVFYGFQLVYYKFFHSFFLWQTVGLAAGLTQFWKSALMAALGQWYLLLALMLPLLLVCVFGGRIEPFHRRPLAGLISIGVSLALYFTAFGLTLPRGYLGEYSADSAIYNFGLLQNTCLELRHIVSRGKSAAAEKPRPEPEQASDTDTDTVTDTERETGYNIMDIDFDGLIAGETDSGIIEMHKYFSSRTPTEKNEYTGFFKGKNLILLTLEGFSYKCIDPELTPTLYKMANGGFVFDNFYNSLWGGSTATGEYAVTTGNFYPAATALEQAGSCALPFALGNQLGKAGYTVKSYHNHTYNYYHRDVAHAAMGYDYKAVGKGLEGISKVWPESDLEMAEITAPEFVNSSTPFHVYYMTVSGHCDYTFNDNMMSYKNRELTAGMDKSEQVRAYYACQIELDRALKSLCDKLEAAGKLEDTVFAMTADHFPYSMDDDVLAELYGLERQGIRNNFDLYRNAFILWTPSMSRPAHISKPCSAIDILPTLSNLFGLEYDSRLITGSDVLSSADSPVILNCVGTIGSGHWITAYGSYNARTGGFQPSADCPISGDALQSYVDDMTGKVNGMEKYSPQILDKNYYAKVFG